MTLSTYGVIKHLDVIKNILSYVIAVCVDTATHAFSFELSLQASNLCTQLLLLNMLLGRETKRLNLGIQAVGRYPQSLCNAPARKPSLCDLANRFDLEFLGKSFPAHKTSFIA